MPGRRRQGARAQPRQADDVVDDQPRQMDADQIRDILRQALHLLLPKMFNNINNVTNNGPAPARSISTVVPLIVGLALLRLCATTGSTTNGAFSSTTNNDNTIRRYN